MQLPKHECDLIHTSKEAICTNHMNDQISQLQSKMKEIVSHSFELKVAVSKGIV